MKKKLTYVSIGFLILIVVIITIVSIYAPSTIDKENPYSNVELNFAQHVAPLIHQNCMPCHRPGQAGPFDLITYEDVYKRKNTINEVITERIMPPWPADPSYRKFINQRYLTDNEIALISSWIDQGAAKGEDENLSEPPFYPAGSMLGEPDLVLKIEPYLIKGSNRDEFLLKSFPYEIEHDTFIRLIEFVPGQRQVLHHMNANLVQFEAGARQKPPDGKKVIPTEEAPSPLEVIKLMDLMNDDGTVPKLTPMVCNYLPGVLYQPLPEGLGGYHMKKMGALYINDMHYGPTPVDVVDSSYFNIFFSEKAPVRPMQEIILGTLGISDIEPPLVIPPDTIMKFRTKAQITRDISLVTITPHMHLLGKLFLAYAVSPKNDTIPLIRIKNWDFRWQYFYTFENLIKIPAGSWIIAEGVYDNTGSNPLNPHNPPQLVMERDGSMRTTDEMFQLIINYLYYEEGDEEVELN